MTLAFLFSSADTLSQEAGKPSRQSSLEAFSNGDYEKASSDFSELLIAYPKDPIYKYYSGVCLIKLNREPEKAVTLLKQAQQGSAVVRTIPADAMFWLGRAQHLSGKYNEAIISYSSFSDLNGKKASRDLGIPEFIQQCERKEGRLAVQVAQQAEKKIIPTDEDRVKAPLVSNTVSIDYEKLLSDALELQYKADSLYKIAEDQKKGLEKGSYAERTKVKTAITETESLAASFQEQADSKYSEAQAAMNKKPFTAGLITVPAATDSTTNKGKLSDTLIVDKKADTIKDTLIITRDTINQEVIIKPTEIQPLADSVAKTIAKTPAGPRPVEVYSVFEVKAGVSDEKISMDPEVPPGLIYRIQVAVFRNPVISSYFKGISPVYGFKVAGKDLKVYYAGMFRKLADANKALVTVRKKGFKDAFVAALYGGKTVSAEKAAALEKEWGKKTLIRIKEAGIASADTLPPTLTFRVEVVRSLKPLKDDVLEGINKLAGTRGLEIVTLPDNTMIYLMGTFITFESAEEYADLLIRNGYNDAKVGAWLGKKEIPVETAKQLFERLE